MSQEETSPFLRAVVEEIGIRHYSIRTVHTYLHWIKRFILFHRKRHPKNMREPEVAAFPTHLVMQRNVSSSTQSIALNTLVFMYRHVLEYPLEEISGITPSKKAEKTP